MPGAQAPGTPITQGREPAIAGESLKTVDAVARFTGSNADFYDDPGAYAPGFMLTPASQAKNLEVRLSAQSPIKAHPVIAARRSLSIVSCALCSSAIALANVASLKFGSATFQARRYPSTIFSFITAVVAFML